MTARSCFWLALCATAALAAPALAYVNGGDYHDTGKVKKKALTDKGYVVATGYHVGERKELRIAAKNDEALNRIVGEALKALPEKEAEKIPLENKR